jgi:hypothetical protein
VTPRRTTTVGTMFSTVLVTALVAAALDAEGLKVWAERLEFGAGRTAALALAEKWAAVGEGLGSTAARASLVRFAASWTADPTTASPPAEPSTEPAQPPPAEDAPAAPDAPAADPVVAQQAEGEEPGEDAGVAAVAAVLPPLTEPPLVRIRGGPVAGVMRDAGTAPAAAEPVLPAVAAQDAGTTVVASATAPAAAPAPVAAPPPAATPEPAAAPSTPVAAAEQGPFAPLKEAPDPKNGEATTYGPKDGKTVLLLGDSMIGSALGTELVRELLKRGGHRVVTAWQPATGLSRGDYFDWGPRMTALMARHKPSIVILTLGTNDGQDLRGPGRKPVFYGSPGWGPGYERLAKAAAERLTRGGATLYWLDLPPMRPPIFARSAREVNLRVKNALTGMPRVQRVPVPPLLVDANGGYSDRSRTTPSFGARASDGVHWSQKSGRYFAEELMKRIAPLPGEGGTPTAAAAAVE